MTTVLHGPEKRFSKVDYVQYTLTFLGPIGVVAKAMHTCVPELDISWEPFLRPEGRRIRAFAPRPSRAASQTYFVMHNQGRTSGCYFGDGVLGFQSQE